MGTSGEIPGHRLCGSRSGEEFGQSLGTGTVTNAESALDSRICLGDSFGVADVALVAHRQLVTTLGTATGEDIPTVLCFHALTEAVGLGPLAVVRLKRTFWHCSTFPERPGSTPPL